MYISCAIFLFAHAAANVTDVQVSDLGKGAGSGGGGRVMALQQPEGAISLPNQIFCDLANVSKKSESVKRLSFFQRSVYSGTHSRHEAAL